MIDVSLYHTQSWMVTIVSGSKHVDNNVSLWPPPPHPPITSLEIRCE